jgi:hypothetical protein
MQIETPHPDYQVGRKAVIERYSCDPSFLIPIRQDLDRDFGYVPREAMVSEALRVRLSQRCAVGRVIASPFKSRGPARANWTKSTAARRQHVRIQGVPGDR